MLCRCYSSTVTEKWVEDSMDRAEIQGNKSGSVYKKLETGVKGLLQQDNDLKHHTKATVEWFNIKNINVLNGPEKAQTLIRLRISGTKNGEIYQDPDLVTSAK